MMYSLPPKREVGYIPAYVYKYWDTNQFSYSFKAAFVRNPWDRLVSAFFRVRDSAKNPQTLAFDKRNLSRYLHFDSFIMALDEKPAFRCIIMSYPCFRPQIEFIEVGGVIAVDFVGRIENLRGDFRILAERFGVSPHNLSNEHKSEHSIYRDYYSTKSAEVVSRIYERHVKALGYSL